MALSADGGAYLWGRNEKGALGTGTAVNVYRAARAHLEAGVSVVGAAVGKAHTLLLSGGGELWAAGAGSVGQLGTGRSPEAQLKWVRSAKGLPDASYDPVTAVSAGADFSVALTRSGRVWACGTSKDGVLGGGTNGERIVQAGRLSYDSQVRGWGRVGGGGGGACSWQGERARSAGR